MEICLAKKIVEEEYSTESEFLKHYDPSVFARPSSSVDNVIFTVVDDCLQVLLVKRSHHPFQGKWSLVGGFVDLENDRNLEATAKRKLAEKTGVKTPYLEQFYTYGGKDRDPRCWSITTVYFALISANGIKLTPGPGASEIKWAPIKNGTVKESLAFDHKKIVKECCQRLRSKVLYTTLPVHLMPNEFSLNELQSVYEVILGVRIEPKSFRRRILKSEVVVETGKFKETGRRPAKLYKRKKLNETYFFVRNFEGSHN